MSTNSPETPETQEAQDVFANLKSLQVKWEQAITSQKSDDFDSYLELLYHFHANILFLEEKTRTTFPVTKVLERRIEPAAAQVTGQTGKLDQSVFEKNLLTPNDLAKLFEKVDIDSMIGGYEGEILAVLQGASPISGVEAVFAKSRGDFHGGNSTKQ